MDQRPYFRTLIALTVLAAAAEIVVAPFAVFLTSLCKDPDKVAPAGVFGCQVEMMIFPAAILIAIATAWLLWRKGRPRAALAACAAPAVFAALTIFYGLTLR